MEGMTDPGSKEGEKNVKKGDDGRKAVRRYIGKAKKKNTKLLVSITKTRF